MTANVTTANVTIRIQQADFDIAREISALTKGRTDIGAVVSFSGICRGSEGSQTIASLTLEHYPGMAEAEIARHVDTAMARWPLISESVRRLQAGLQKPTLRITTALIFACRLARSFLVLSPANAPCSGTEKTPQGRGSSQGGIRSKGEPLLL